MTEVYSGVAWRPSVLTSGEARAMFGLPAKTPLAVTIGRLSEQKNHTLLIDMLPKLP